MSNITSAREKIMNTVYTLARQIGNGEDNIFLDPKVLERHTDQIIFELIKDAYIEKSRKDTKSLYKHVDGASCDVELKQYSRSLQYSKYYRNELADEFDELFNYVSEELENVDMSSPRNRPAGYKISKYDFEMLKAIRELKLLKYLTDRRVTSVKKVSNLKLDDEHEFYRKYFQHIYSTILYDSDYIMYSILLFTTELKYNIETVYRLSTKLSEYNTYKSNNKFDEYVFEKFSIFTKSLHYAGSDLEYIKENSLILMKLEDIETLRPENINKICQNYFDNLQFAFFAKQLVLTTQEVKDIIQNASDSEKRNFIENHYNIWTLLNEQLTWGNKKEKYIRDIYDSLLKNIQPPKIK